MPGRPERKQIPLRLDPAIAEAVRRWAEDDLRSVNAQIEKLLHDALVRAGRLPRGGGPGSDGSG
ncbi:Arc family DNA-binding protein [Nocardioides sp. zg-ZUI104]|nr:Arc family DNA-binding protein [Nocardioides faecalis]